MTSGSLRESLVMATHYLIDGDHERAARSLSRAADAWADMTEKQRTDLRNRNQFDGAPEPGEAWSRAAFVVWSAYRLGRIGRVGDEAQRALFRD